MTDLFLLFLGVAWLLALWPAAVRARRAAPLSTATRFKRRMSLIAPKAARAGRWILLPRASGSSDRTARRTRLRILRRRKQMFTTLLLAAPLTTIASAVRGGEAWIAPLCVAVVLSGYVTFLLLSKRRRRAARRVTALARAPEVDFTEPVYEQRRA
jgi:hypothetical protein